MLHLKHRRITHPEFIFTSFKDIASNVCSLSPENFMNHLQKGHRRFGNTALRQKRQFFKIEKDLFVLTPLNEGIRSRLNPSVNPGEASRAFFFCLHGAVKRLRSLGEIRERYLFPIAFREDIDHFSTHTGFDVDIGAFYLVHFIEHGIGKNFSPVLWATSQSQYFHELIHGIQYNRYDEPHEISALLGEFLYNPSGNAIRNQSEFVTNLPTKARRFLLESENCDSSDRCYGKAWLAASRILLWEYQNLSKDFMVPSSFVAQFDYLKQLPELFFNLEQKALDRIIKTYAFLSLEDVEKISKKLGEEIGILF